MDSTALNYDATATHSNGDCDYPPEVGLWFGSIDATEGTIEVFGSSDKDFNNITFQISGAVITGAGGGAVEENDLLVNLTADTFTATGELEDGSGLLTVLSFSDGGSEFCLASAAVSAPGYDAVNVTLGGCSVFVGIDGGTVASEEVDAGVDIPAGALTESENIAVGEVAEELPEEVDNATGFEVDEMVAFTPFDIEFEEPVEITVSYGRSSRSDEYLCYLEDAHDTEWTVVEGASCNGGVCTADVTSFGIFATCILIDDCNGDLGGFAYLDDCGECVGGNTGNEAGFTLDECGLCSGPGMIDWYIDADGDNLGAGNGVPFCSDTVPEGYVPNANDPEPNCATNNTDECGLCAGNGPDDGFDCDGNCIAAGGYDCNNICGGSAENDDCGICGGDNASCTDCNGVVGGDAFVDGCNNCVGGNTGEEACPTDCNGVDGGTAWVDPCGACVAEGDSSCEQGCDGNWTNNGDPMSNDECGVCGGDNSSCSGCTDPVSCSFSPDATIDDGSCTYPEQDFDCLGNCVITVDCLGVCGGTAQEDECGICNGPGASTWYGDSDGDELGDPDDLLVSCDSPEGFVPNDDDEEPDCATNDTDSCGVCAGPGDIYECGCSDIPEGDCDCDGNSLDLCGICGGDDTSCMDCAGVPNGSNSEDNCGVCDDDPDNDCIQDCDGVWGGSAYEDNCGTCDDDPENDCIQDCAGVLGGSAYEDDCGVCDIDAANDNADMDCNGDCFGDAFLDSCDVCSGGESGHEADSDIDCNGDCFGTAEIDECGICAGPGYYECGDGSLVCDEAECSDSIDYCLDLHSGANLVSFHALLEDASIGNMMSSVEGNASGVIGEGVAANYNPVLGWMGSLNTISPNSGYWIKVDAVDQLCLEGAIPTDPGIEYNLHSGANLISFPVEGAVAIPDAIPDDVEPFITGIIGEGVAANNNPILGWMGSLSALSGGKGYWMITTQDISFSFDTSTMSRTRKEDEVALLAPEGLELHQSTRQAFYFIEDIMVEGEPIQMGDWVMAYHENTLVGARKWNGIFTDIPAMGDDGSTETMDYCNSQSALTLRIVKKDNPEKTYYVVDTLPKWEEMALQSTQTLTAKMLPSESVLISAYPNPFNPVTSIQFGVSEEGMMNIAVYDISGRLVENLANQSYLPGYHSVNWNADTFASGIYFLSVHTNGVSKIQKLILMK